MVKRSKKERNRNTKIPHDSDRSSHSQLTSVAAALSPDPSDAVDDRYTTTSTRLGLIEIVDLTHSDDSEEEKRTLNYDLYENDITEAVLAPLPPGVFTAREGFCDLCRSPGRVSKHLRTELTPTRLFSSSVLCEYCDDLQCDCDIESNNQPVRKHRRK